MGSYLFLPSESQAQLTLFKDNKTCLYGYTDSMGEWIVQPQYLYAEEFYDGHAIVGINNLKGLLGPGGSVLVPLQYDYIIPNYNWYALKHDTLYDVFDISVQKITVKDFPYPINQYKNDYLIFSDKQTYGLFADNTFLLNHASAIDVDMHSKSAVIHYRWQQQDSIRIYLLQQHAFTPDTYSYLRRTDTDSYLVKKGKSYGIIDHTGKTVVPFAYTQMYLSEAATAPVILQKKNNKGYDVYSAAGKKLNRKPYPYIDTTSLIQYNIYIVTQKKKQGILDENGNVKIPFTYDSITYEPTDNGAVYLLYTSNGIQVADARGNVLHKEYYSNIAFMKPLYAPEIEYSYEAPIPPYVISILPDTSVILLHVYDSTQYLPGTEEYPDAGYRLYSNGKYGMITAGQEHVLPPAYDFIFPFENKHGYTKILQNGKFGILDLSGEVIIQPDYLFIGENPLSDESFIFMTEDYLFGMKNAADEILIEPVYTMLSGYDAEKDYCWAKHADSSELRLIDRNGVHKSPYDFAYPVPLDGSSGVILQAVTGDASNQTYKTGVLDGNTLQQLVPFMYEHIARVNDSIYLCSMEATHTDSTYTDVYIQQMRIDSVTGCSVLPDGVIAVERCYSWGYLKNGSWLIKPGKWPGAYDAELSDLLQMQAQTTSSYTSDLYGDHEITLEFDTTQRTLSKLLNYEVIQAFSTIQKRTFGNLYSGEDMQNRLVLYDRDYVSMLIGSASEPEEEMYYAHAGGYGSTSMETITAVVHTPAFGELRLHNESWVRSSHYVSHKSIAYTLTPDNQLKRLSLADITNHLQHATLLSALINLQLDSLQDIQLPCTDREAIVELATGYQFEKEGLLFYFEDERAHDSYEYEEIQVLLPYAQLLQHFRKSAYLPQLYKHSLQQ